MVDVEGSGEQADRQLLGIVSAIDDFREPLAEIGLLTLASFKENFARQGRPRWAPLARLTLMNRLERGFSGTAILNASGSLMRSATVRGAAGNIWNLEKTFVEVGTEHINADIHQRGSDAKLGGPIIPTQARFMVIDTPDGWVGRETVRIPPRPFIMLQPEDLERIGRVMSSWTSRRIQISISGGAS